MVTDPLIGRIVDGRYEVTARLARGGMATVYRANDRRLDREVAVKVMHPHLAESEDFVARFRREARAAARLSHPHVVQVFDQGFVDESFYLTMEFVDGEDLRARLRREGPLTLAAALATAEAVLDALAAAHRRDLVHRDIKPENVLLPKDGGLKVADFGLARAVSDATAVSTGTVLGTVAYLAPEIVTRGEATTASDVYATGILLYEMLTGTQPFTGSLPIQVAFQHVNDDIPAPSLSVDWIPTEVDELVAALTARDPAERLRTGGAALNRLRQVRDGLDAKTLGSRAATTPAPELTDGRTAPLSRLPFSGTVALPIGEIEGREEEVSPSRAARHKKKAAPRRKLLLLLLGVLLAGAALTGWFYLEGPGAYSPLPAVTGQAEDLAVGKLREAGFTPMILRQNHDTVPAGQVISTDPTAHSSTKRGATVRVAVSLGIRQVTLPALVGRPLVDVRKDLDSIQIAQPTLKEEFHATAPAGQVTAAALPDGKPAAEGATVSHSTTLTLTVSKGREPVQIPDVSGRSKDAAIKQLERAGLQVTIGEEKHTMDVPEGNVISQNPKPNEGQFYRGDKVTLTVSLGPPWVKVPNVIGLSEARARRALEEAGLVPVRQPGWFTVLDLVRKSNPAAGTDVRKGSTVTITVV